jgi:hypothetical protein
MLRAMPGRRQGLISARLAARAWDLGNSRGTPSLLSVALEATLTRRRPSQRPKAWLSCSGGLGPDLRREQLASVRVVSRVRLCHARV